MPVNAIFSGLSAFPITPADPDGRVDVAQLERVLVPLAAANVDSIGLLGSTGTYPYLARAERRRCIECAVDMFAGARPVMVGVGALRTDDAVANARDAAQAGADGVLLAAMSYYPLQDREVLEHFRAVAAATDLPICIYNNPTATHFAPSHGMLKSLSDIDTVVAIKNPGPAQGDGAGVMGELRALFDADFAIGFSGDLFAPGMFLHGADAWYSVAGGLFPRSCLALTRAGQARDVAGFETVADMFAPLAQLIAEFSGVRVMYGAANALGRVTTQAPRPLLPLEKADMQRIEAAIAPLVAFEKTGVISH